MRGVHVDFIGGGAIINFNRSIEGFAATIQNAGVHIGQSKGSDITFPTKGNNLHTRGVQGDFTSMAHLSAGLGPVEAELLEFDEAQSSMGEEDKLASVRLLVGEYTGDYVQLQLSAESNGGEVQLATMDR